MWTDIVNYQNELDKIIEKLDNRPKLLLHACCAPCSSYCLEYLGKYFDITVFFYNPNITEKDEYDKRVIEEKRLIDILNNKYNYDIKCVEGSYDLDLFLQLTKGMEECPEGGDRCGVCFALRLEESAKYASTNGFDYFTTSLTISPLKNAERLNNIGQSAGAKYGVDFLPSDFKKRNGYKRSVELSAEYGLYRQNYCGCRFSKLEMERRNAKTD